MQNVATLKDCLKIIAHYPKITNWKILVKNDGIRGKQNTLNDEIFNK